MSYPCESCDKTFKEKRYLAHHIKAVHLKSFVEKCNVCQHTFASKKDLTRHQELQLCGTKKSNQELFCCGKLFKHKKSLKNNKYDHSQAEDSFSCNKCKKSFKRKFNFSKHQESCKASTENEKVTCLICQKSFSPLGNTLKRHMRRRHSKTSPSMKSMDEKSIINIITDLGRL